MTSTQVKKIRAALKLSIGEFASVLGVHGSTVYRWETLGVHVDPGTHTARVLALLDGSSLNLSRVGASVKRSLARGPLYGLRQLLAEIL